MGVHCHYQAMPETGSLFRRLIAEPAFAVCYSAILHHPSGPFEFLAEPVEECEGLLDYLAEEEAIGSRAVAEHTLADLRTELRQALRDDPWIEDRSAYHKLGENLFRTLTEQLTRLGHPDSARYTDHLIMGCVSLSVPDASILLVPAATVAEAAGWLRRISTRAFDDDDYGAYEYLIWRDVYLEAAEREEVIVIG
jgi:hypothetical protein